MSRSSCTNLRRQRHNTADVSRDLRTGNFGSLFKTGFGSGTGLISATEVLGSPDHGCGTV